MYLGYNLPPERIAQRPIEGARDTSKLLVFRNNEIEDSNVFHLPDYLRTGDVLVLNNTKVLPYRFFTEHGEILLCSLEANSGLWRALARPMAKFEKVGTFQLNKDVSARATGRTPDDYLLLELKSELPLEEALSKGGVMPIPPYIRRGHADEHDAQTYQTVFAQTPGSVAAPTASLHLTPNVLAAIKERGVKVVSVTLHLGPASFLPVRGEIATHSMPSERYEVSGETWTEVEAAKREGRRVVAVGTSAVRTLESFVRGGRADTLCETKLFITPGFEFQIVDVLMTNFHQPDSTHLVLVNAFMGGDATQRIYEHALATDYRFLSYGDSMLLERS